MECPKTPALYWETRWKFPSWCFAMWIRKMRKTSALARVTQNYFMRRYSGLSVSLAGLSAPGHTSWYWQSASTGLHSTSASHCRSRHIKNRPLSRWPIQLASGFVIFFLWLPLAYSRSVLNYIPVFLALLVGHYIIAVIKILFFSLPSLVIPYERFVSENIIDPVLWLLQPKKSTCCYSLRSNK